MSALFGYAITVVPRVYTYYLREDALEFMHFKKSPLCKLLFSAKQWKTSLGVIFIYSWDSIVAQMLNQAVL